WKLEVCPVYAANYQPLATLTGKLPVVTRDDSPYGAGWGIQGIDRLFPVTDGVIWQSGNGDLRFFKRAGDTYLSPVGDFGRLTRTALSETTYAYTYTARDRVSWAFDNDGLLGSVTDTHGLART